MIRIKTYGKFHDVIRGELFESECGCGCKFQYDSNQSRKQRVRKLESWKQEKSTTRYLKPANALVLVDQGSADASAIHLILISSDIISNLSSN